MGHGKIYTCTICRREWKFHYGFGFSYITLAPYICKKCGEIKECEDVSKIHKCQKCGELMDQIKEEQPIVNCPQCKIPLKEIGFIEWD